MKPLLKFDPATGEEKPYPSEAEQYRAYHGDVAWLFNPYSGERRDARDVGSDVLGYLIEISTTLGDNNPNNIEDERDDWEVDPDYWEQ
jgi:hypothetical protein